jgi:hypothetical protein
MQGLFFAREINARSPATDTTSNPLLSFYGGGWEYAFAQAGVVSKLGDTTFFFWNASVSPTGVTLEPPSLVLKREYFGPVMIHRWLRGDGTSEWSTPWSAQKCVAIQPVIGGQEIDLSNAALWPPYESRFQVHVILLHIGKDRYVPVWTNLRLDGPENRVRFEEDAAAASTSVTILPPSGVWVRRVIAQSVARLAG